MTSERVEPDVVPQSAPGAERQTAMWVAPGLASGALGAFVVALFFLGIDLADNRPLWTPAALGSALLRGAPLAPDAGIEPALVVGYTGVHGGVFIALGLLAAYGLTLARRPRTSGFLVATIAALFVGFEILFVAFGSLFMPGAIGELGAGWVAVANALSAVVMGSFLIRRVPAA